MAHLVAMQFVGTNGIMVKITTMDAVKMYSHLDKIQIIVATKSAEV